MNWYMKFYNAKSISNMSLEIMGATFDLRASPTL
jgi:hypothetical protein